MDSAQSQENDTQAQVVPERPALRRQSVVIGTYRAFTHIEDFFDAHPIDHDVTPQRPALTRQNVVFADEQKQLLDEKEPDLPALFRFLYTTSDDEDDEEDDSDAEISVPVSNVRIEEVSNNDDINEAVNSVITASDSESDTESHSSYLRHLFQQTGAVVQLRTDRDQASALLLYVWINTVRQVFIDATDLANHSICSICRDAYVMGESVYALRCGHKLHRQCAHDMIMRSATFARSHCCPECRQSAIIGLFDEAEDSDDDDDQEMQQN